MSTLQSSLADRLKQWDTENPWATFIAKAVRGEITSADDAYFIGLANVAFAWFAEQNPTRPVDDFQKALGALADLGLNDDMTREQMQHKALRVYHELGGKGPGQ